MAEPNGPTVRRKRLGSELRRLREAAGRDQADAAAHLECSTSKISRLETGQGIAKALEIRSLLDLYGVSEPAQREAILAVHRQAAESGWWEQEELPGGMDTYVGLEHDAQVLKGWELGYVHGLCQTTGYARAVLSSAGLPPDEVERQARVRARRQERLRGPDALRLWVVMDEVAVLRLVGGAQAMHEQIDHLVEVAALPNVRLQIVPLARGAHPGQKGSFTLLEFDGGDPAVGYVDSQAGNLFLERVRQVRGLVRTFDQLAELALSPEESVDCLTRIRGSGLADVIRRSP